MGNDLLWNPEKELLDAEELQKLRVSKLRKQLDYVYTNSEYYKNKFKEAGAHPDDIKNIEDFRRLPVFMDKERHKRGSHLLSFY